MKTSSLIITALMLSLSANLSYAVADENIENNVSSTSLVEPVKSADLAKVILKPSQKTMLVNKDPFKPIMSKGYVDESISLNPNDAPSQILADAMGDLNVIGIVRMDKDYRAFITTTDKKGVYKVQDKIGNYTIERIEPNQVVFKLGENEIVKKRGKL